MVKAPFSARLKARSAAPAAVRAVRVGPVLAAGLLWLAAGLSAGYWLLQLWGHGPLTPVSAIAGNPLQADAAQVARALGAVPEVQAAAPAAPPASSRFQLIGLVSQPGRGGAALISVDGEPPRPFAVGSVVHGEWVLQSVQRRQVRLGADRGGAAALELSLPDTPP
jgi:general secretion pathway protein C